MRPKYKVPGLVLHCMFSLVVGALSETRDTTFRRFNFASTSGGNFKRKANLWVLIFHFGFPLLGEALTGIRTIGFGFCSLGFLFCKKLGTKYKLLGFWLEVGLLLARFFWGEAPSGRQTFGFPPR